MSRTLRGSTSGVKRGRVIFEELAANTPIQSTKVKGCKVDDKDAEGYRRKDKSLGLLCENFMRYCLNNEEYGFVVSLDQVAKSLDIERRRIYDVTNILEALDIVSRKDKNEYVWHGTMYLSHTMKKLRDSALQDVNAPTTVIPTERLERDATQSVFYGDLEKQAVGKCVPRLLRPADLGTEGKKIDTPLPLFDNGLLAYLSSPPHWLYPVHYPHQSAAAAGYSHRGVATLNPLVTHDVVMSDKQLAELGDAVARSGWRAEVKKLAACAAEGLTWQLSDPSQIPAPTEAECFLPGWLPDESKLECFLEEEPFPADVRLQSLPLLSELMCLHVDEAAARAKTGGVPEVSRVPGGITVDSKRQRRDKSLGVLTQRFLKIFLLDRKVITLDFAIPLVLTDDDSEDNDAEGALTLPLHDEEGRTFQTTMYDGRSSSSAASTNSRLRANAQAQKSGKARSGTDLCTDSTESKKGRRLYDIANVLVAVGLLDRVYVRVGGNRRQAFRWRGPAYVAALPGAPVPEWAIRKIAPPLDARGNVLPAPVWSLPCPVVVEAPQLRKPAARVLPIVRPAPPAAPVEALQQVDEDELWGSTVTDPSPAVAAPVVENKPQQRHKKARHSTRSTPYSGTWTTTSYMTADATSAGGVPFQYQPAPTPMVPSKTMAFTIMEGEHCPTSAILDRTAHSVRLDLMEDLPRRHAKSEKHVNFLETSVQDTSFSSVAGSVDLRDTNVLSAPTAPFLGQRLGFASPGLLFSPGAMPAHSCRKPTLADTVAPQSIALIRTGRPHALREVAAAPESQMSPSHFMATDSPAEPAADNHHAVCTSPEKLWGQPFSILSQNKNFTLTRSSKRLNLEDLAVDSHFVSRGKVLLTELDKAAPQEQHVMAASGVTEALDASMIASDPILAGEMQTLLD